MKNAIKEKSYQFAIKTVQTYKYLSESRKEFVLSKQLLCSGTAVGALVLEAEQAESKSDFIHKMSITLKEANESDYWIDLLKDSDYISESDHKILCIDLHEILRLLTSIIKTSKNNIKS